MLSNLNSVKKVALKMYLLSWWDKRQLLGELPLNVQKEVKKELLFLKRFSKEHIDEMLLKFSQNQVLVSEANELVKALETRGLSKNIKEQLKQNLMQKERLPSALLLSIDVQLKNNESIA